MKEWFFVFNSGFALTFAKMPTSPLYYFSKDFVLHFSTKRRVLTWHLIRHSVQFWMANLTGGGGGGGCSFAQ